MRIALDGAAISRSMTGVGRYFHCLLQELVPLDSSIDYTLFLKDGVDTGLDFPNLSIRTLKRRGSYFLWQNTLLDREVRRGRFDLFWSPNYTLPLLTTTPSIVTVHDVSWKALPGDYPAFVRIYRNLTGGFSMRKARRIITVSDFSRSEIVRRAAIPADRIVRIHEGVSARFQRAAADPVERFKERHGISGKRVLGFLGSFFARRHVPEIIAALEIVRRQYPDTVLMLVGENHGVPSAMLAGNRPEIRWLRRLPEDEISMFYSSLSLFLYISEYEGFGLPPMEALNCGTLSLLLHQGSLAELYDDLALFVSQPDPEIIAAAISQFLQQEEEGGQQFLDRWQVRKPYFSWKRAAEEHLREITGLR